MENRPQGRKTNVTGQSAHVEKHGSGVGGGPVGNGKQQSTSGRTGQSQPSGQERTSTRSRGKSLAGIIAAAVVLLGGGGAGVGSALSNNTPQSAYSNYEPAHEATVPEGYSNYTSYGDFSDLASLFGGSGATSTTQVGWTGQNNTKKLDRTVDAAAREKYNQPLGNGKDTVTIMVYMCGTDLESTNGMGTSDLQEMANANIGSNVNLIVYTGGCKRWRNDIISSSKNQIYQVTQGGLKRLSADEGAGAMTDPTNLASFIKYCKKNFPANRNALIFWDHGGGSLSGYGYDEKKPGSGSMTLKKIDQALSSGGMKFDFIGFDACLMSTLETAIVLEPYTDYMIASEESEPGIGWYYTNWLTALSKNTSMDTLDIGQKICDDFVDVCAQKCRGQKTTLSLVDLAELEGTLPEKFRSFSTDVCDTLEHKGYDTVSNARSSAREFAASNKIDQIDLTHLALNLDTKESKALADVLLSAVKYNRTSSNMTNAYGLSMYFPYSSVRKVDAAVATYDAIGIDSEYSKMIQEFASMEAGGQAAAGGTANPFESFFGGSSGSFGSGSAGTSSSGSHDNAYSTDMLGQLLTTLLGGGSSGIQGLSPSNSLFFGRSMPVEDMAEFISKNSINPEHLVWTRSAEDPDTWAMTLSEDEWTLIQELELNVFVDDGEGYIDLGLDNVFNFLDDGSLAGSYDGTWLALNGQPVAYYHMDTTYNDDGQCIISGYIPVMLNGVRAKLMIVFDDENPYGAFSGLTYAYDEEETETVAKACTELMPGDQIEFLCDYYTYDGVYEDSYVLGDPMIYDGTFELSNVALEDNEVSAAYLFTDIYNNSYWSPAIP